MQFWDKRSMEEGVSVAMSVLPSGVSVRMM